ncbi:hypothetical protein Afil01_33240 [Actinorhabdospora filicis]|uniref:VTT domain-containing protein n=1 Tax=Actinorhabdospora filicis TaxID=1785913 RepID=A0A9W6W3T6_9ACTN|nr:DedA family protein [Actinorhabdospora filicis]GLZ78517.1 hypothetical protein Afil01_33240 [Actinorhabdospora filicis]
MAADLLDLARSLVSSPWIHLILFAITALDAVLPLVPSESVVIVVGAYAAGGRPNLVLAVIATALGALGGDYASYWIGRGLGGRAYRRMRPGTRRRAALDRAAAELDRRGGAILILSRYVPGLRNVTTLAAGVVGYPQGRFLFFKAIAAATSAPIGILLGYLGGVAAQDHPLIGMAIGLGLAIVISVVIERLHARSARAKTPE